MTITSETKGYADPRYADSLREFGEPRELPNCGGWILVRQIPGTTYRDSTGCYPVFACRNWKRLHEDMEHLSSDLVSLVLVTDPFSEAAPSYLERCFDLVKPFKTHYVADLRYPLERFINRWYRYNARKSLKTMDVEVCYEPLKYLDDWIRLYDNLIDRHHITGTRAFSRSCFETQLGIRGMVMVLGRCTGEVVGATLVLVHGQNAYSHLSAYGNKGYQIRASYGIYWEALAHLREQGVRYFDVGGTAGIKDDPHNGLTQFKKGWSNDRCMTYLCGRVFDRGKYESLCEQDQIASVDYFPAYRT